MDGTNDIANISLNSAGAASLGISTLRPGQHTIAAQYVPNNPKFSGSVSSQIAEQITLGSVILPTDNIGGQTAAPAAGQFAVSKDGAATYSYPIWVPKGRHGIEPSLYLKYSSRSGNGLLGVGWSLQGLSAIIRCKRDIARDGNNAPITFTQSDALCLDGERLVAVPSVDTGISNQYGAAGTEYRTEQDQFVRVIEGSADDKGPLSFEVQFKDGRSFLYGTSAGSRLEGQQYNGRLVRLNWALSEIRDRFGNNLTVQYCLIGGGSGGNNCPDYFKNGPKTDYEQLPISIEYTGTLDGTLQPMRSITFEYEIRPDFSEHYISGLALQTGYLLKTIILSAPNSSYQVSPVKSYTFGYQQSQMTVRSLLSQIQECDDQPTPLGVCAVPTTFKYSYETTDGFVDVDTGVQAAVEKNHQLGQIVIGDFNGDGCDDFIYTTFFSWSSLYEADYRLSSCHDAIASGITPFPAPGNPALFELNPSAAGNPVPATTFPTPLTDPSITPCGRFPSSFPCSYQELIAIDLDLDGRADLLSYSVTDHGNDVPNNWVQDIAVQAFLASGIAPTQWDPSKGLFHAQNGYIATYTMPKLSEVPPAPYSYKNAYVGDINGDGLPDFIRLTPTGWTFQLSEGRTQIPLPDCAQTGNACLGLGPVSSLYPGSTSASFAPVPIVDIDQDGTADLLLRDSGNDSNYVAVSVDTSCNPRALPLGLKAGDWDRFLDVNGDGLPDLISCSDVVGCSLFINTGHGFANRGPFAFATIPTGNVMLFDYDGDGTQDIVYDNGTELRVVLTGQRFKDVAITDQATGQPIAAGANDEPLGSNLHAFDANGDGLMDLIQIAKDQHVHVYLRKGQKPDLLLTIVDRGAKTDITYAPITSAAVYKTTVQPGIVSDGPPGVHPGTTYVHNRGPWVVASYTTPGAGWGSPKTYTYMYADARSSLVGRGWLGFGSVTMTDNQTGAVTTTTYDNATIVGSAYPYAMKPLRQETRISLPSNGSEYFNDRITTIRYGNSGTSGGECKAVEKESVPIVVLPCEVLQQEWEGDFEAPALLRQFDTTYAYDQFGNLANSKRSTADGYQDTNSFTYDYSTHLWLVARPNRFTATSSTPDHQSVTRTISFATSPETGAIEQQTIEPEGTSSSYKSTYYWVDKYGVVQGATSVDRSFGWRQDAFPHEPLEDIYPISHINGLQHTEWFAFHPGYGVLAAHQDLNVVTDNWQYDTFGRLKKTIYQRGGNASWTYSNAFHLYPVGIEVDTQYSDGQATTHVYDPVLFEAERTSLGFDGKVVRTAFVYNGLDLVSEARGPCIAGDLQCWNSHLTKYSYDNLRRLLSTQFGDGSVRTRAYSGLRVTLADEVGNQRYLIQDQLGQIIKSVAISDGNREVATSYTYEPFRLLQTVTDAYENVQQMHHDVRGRLVALNDPDSHNRSFDWTAFDELETEHYGKGSSTMYLWDQVGRPYSVTDGSGTMSFIWDIAPSGIGKLARVTSPDKVSQIFSYDPLSRVSTSTENVDSSSFSLGFTYDSYGRLSTVAYPMTAGSTPLVVQQNYNQYGFPFQMLDKNTGDMFWQINALNERGQITNEDRGDGMNTQATFDTRGRVQSIVTTGKGSTLQQIEFGYYANGSVRIRSNQFSSYARPYVLSEFFKYDSLDRLKNIHSIGLLQPPPPSVAQIFDQSFEYDDIGNLKQRTTNAGVGPNLNYQYGQNGAGPHAVTTVNSDTYDYDALGNQVSGSGRTVSYNSFDLPKTILLDGLLYSFHYNPFHQRAAKYYPNGDSRLYFGDFYERRKEGGKTTDVFRIPGLHGRAAVQVQSSGTGTTDPAFFLHEDNLASIQAVVDKTGTSEQLWYEPFGQWIDPTNPENPAVPPLDSISQGFTSQSEDPELGLINMKGRIYDPKLAHFLTPDPLILNPFHSESLNRYSYAWNNPLKWTDPSGFQDEGGGDAGVEGGYDPGSGFDWSGFAGLAGLLFSPSSGSYQRSGPARATLQIPLQQTRAPQSSTASDNGINQVYPDSGIVYPDSGIALQSVQDGALLAKPRVWEELSPELRRSLISVEEEKLEQQREVVPQRFTDLSKRMDPTIFWPSPVDFISELAGPLLEEGLVPIGESAAHIGIISDVQSKLDAMNLVDEFEKVAKEGKSVRTADAEAIARANFERAEQDRYGRASWRAYYDLFHALLCQFPLPPNGSVMPPVPAPASDPSAP